jgi:hypothetical protein
VAFSSLGSFFTFAFYTGLFIKTAPPGLANDASLFNFLTEAPHQAFKAFP